MVLSDLATILTSVKTATDIAKLLKETDLSLEKAEIKLKLAELIGALADVKMQLADVRELILEKDDTIRSLKDELKLKAIFVFESPYYWSIEESNKVGPYCPSCFDDSHKQARLIESANTKGHWTCCVCGKVFRDNTYRPQTVSRSIMGR
jgi:ribosomal protein L37AE/L43A